MYQITNITSDPLQMQTFVLPDGTSFQLTMRFVPMQYSWVIQSLVYTGSNGSVFTLNNFRIFNSPNLLHQYKNQIPFGIACKSVANREPSLAQDFSSMNSILYVLTSAEVNQFAEFLANG